MQSAHGGVFVNGDTQVLERVNLVEWHCFMWVAEGEEIRGDRPGVIILAPVWIEMCVKGHDVGFVDINPDSALLTP
jgi:hypothetical protein